MPNTGNKPAYITTHNIFLDLGFQPKKALALQFKAKILSAILHEVRTRKFTQAKLVEILDEHQPVVSNLLRGKISRMSIEKLLIYAHRLGLALDVRKPRNHSRPHTAA